MVLRYGLIGSGMMGQEHIRNIALVDGAEVVAVADPDEGMRQAAASLAGTDRAFADYRDMLSADLADAYVIASPNHTHISIGLDTVAAGKPILMEKPLCTTPDDSRRLKAAAEAAGIPVWVAMEYRYMPAVARLIADAAKGAAGAVTMLSIREHRFPFLAKVGGWNRFSAKTGGTMVEKCCHFFDLMRLVLKAEPVRVYASGGCDANHRDERYDGKTPDIIDNGFALVDFDNGTRAMLELCMFAEGSEYQEEIAVIGAKAKLEARVPGPDRFHPNGAKREAQIVTSPRATQTPVHEDILLDPAIRAAGDHHGSTFYQHEKFAAMVRTGGAPDVTLHDGLMAVIMGAAAETSIRSGTPVTLNG